MRRSHSLATTWQGAFDIDELPKGHRGHAPTTTGVATRRLANKEIIIWEIYYCLTEGNVVYPWQVDSYGVDAAKLQFYP